MNPESMPQSLLAPQYDPLNDPPQIYVVEDPEDTFSHTVISAELKALELPYACVFYSEDSVPPMDNPKTELGVLPTDELNTFKKVAYKAHQLAHSLGFERIGTYFNAIVAQASIANTPEDSFQRLWEKYNQQLTERTQRNEQLLQQQAVSLEANIQSLALTLCSDIQNPQDIWDPVFVHNFGALLESMDHRFLKNTTAILKPLIEAIEEAIRPKNAPTMTEQNPRLVALYALIVQEFQEQGAVHPAWNWQLHEAIRSPSQSQAPSPFK